MKRSGKIALITAAIFVVLGLVLMLVSAVLSGGADRLEDRVEDQLENYFETNMVGVTVVTKDDGAYDRWESYEESNIYEVETRNIHSLAVDWASGRVEITPWEEDYIQIAEVSNREIGEQDALRWRVDDYGTLHIECGRNRKGITVNPQIKSLQVLVPGELAESWQSFHVNSASAAVHIRDMAAGKLMVDTASGNVEISGASLENGVVMTASGTIDFSGTYQRLQANSASGDITVESLGDGQFTEIDTASGSVRLSGIVGELSLDSASGEITATAITARDVSADSTSGDVRLELLSCPRELEVETTSGDVELTLPESSGFRLEFDHASGDLEKCEFPLSRERGQYLTGDGRGNFSVETTSGDLKIYMAK